MHNTTDQATEIVKLMLLAQKEGRLNDMVAYYATDAVWPCALAGPHGDKLQGRAEIARFVKAVTSNVEFLESEITDIISDGRKVVVTGRERLRFRESGREISNEFAIVYDMADGLIRKVDVYDRMVHAAPPEELYRNW